MGDNSKKKKISARNASEMPDPEAGVKPRPVFVEVKMKMKKNKKKKKRQKKKETFARPVTQDFGNGLIMPMT